MAGQQYKPAMRPVLIVGIERPGLPALLADRGLTARARAAHAAVALVAEHAPRPDCPAVIEAASPDSAGALLDGGAADVVLRSDPDTLVAARLTALLRRQPDGQVRFGDLVIDTVERRVTRAGEPLALLPREYALLLFLARRGGTLVDHRTLHQALWDRGFDPGTNVIAVHISRLRAKLGEGPVTVITERGRGYRLVLSIADRSDGG